MMKNKYSFEAKMVFGCGCGAKKVARQNGAVVVPRQNNVTNDSNRVAAAKTYQSATMTRPAAPPVRKTV